MIIYNNICFLYLIAIQFRKGIYKMNVTQKIIKDINTVLYKHNNIN